jgi:hypothetical protein
MNRLVGVLALLACTYDSADSGASNDCKDYVACAYKTGAAPGSLDSKYGANGSCWTTSSTAENCLVTCRILDGVFKSSGMGADAGCTFGM